eukprot:2071554-Amphidinium_carterae.2
MSFNTVCVQQSLFRSLSLCRQTCCFTMIFMYRMLLSWLRWSVSAVSGASPLTRIADADGDARRALVLVEEVCVVELLVAAADDDDAVLDVTVSSGEQPKNYKQPKALQQRHRQPRLLELHCQK